MAKDKDAGKSTKVEPTGEQSETVKEKEAVTTPMDDKPEVKKEIETAKSQTAKEKTKEVVDESTKAAKAKQGHDAAFIAPYVKAYPGERVFHITSDKQVFLERDRGLAVLHQNSLSGEEKVQTIKVK